MFLCHQHFLPGNHRFWKQIKEFRKGVVVTQGPPKRLTTAEIAEWHNRLAPKGDGFAGFAKEHNSTHIPGSWELPYATTLIFMHNIDVMHQECNMAESIISMCLDDKKKTKDNFKAQRDLAVPWNYPSLEIKKC
jgi:hypothetical protein